MRRSERTDVLLGYAQDHPLWTAGQAARDLGWSLQLTHRAIRWVRLRLRDDEINLIANPQGHREPWLYQLVGTMPAASPWAVSRLGDTESRLVTMRAVVTSIRQATDARSRDGRRARVFERHFTRALEDLAEIGG